MGSSRKYPHAYHGQHFGIPNAWGVLWPGIPNAQRGEEGFSPGILKGRAKNSDLSASEVRKTSPVCVCAKQTEPQRYGL